MGDHRISQQDANEKDFEVSKVIIHENYNGTETFENDICLLVLSKNVDNSSSSVGFIWIPPEQLEYRYRESILIFVGVHLFVCLSVMEVKGQ